jgi:predicted anti-sigma-YlaC factor YlaD
MSDHVLELLGAYLDGELHNGQLRRVETHLAKCQTCLEEYQELKALSVMLREAPLPDFPAPDRFAAEVALRLPHTTVKATRRIALELGWWLAPVGLIVIWVFLGTTLLVSNMVTTANDLGLLKGVSAWLVSSPQVETFWAGTLGQFGFLAGTNLQWAELAEAFARTTVFQFAWQISIALLYLSWLAIWWARHSRQGPDRAFDSGNAPEGGSRPTI